MTLPRYSAYRDSGVEWLGEVPAHWTTVRLGALFREAVDEGCEGLPILSVSIHDGVSDRELGDEEMDRKVTRSDDATKYRRVEPGDLVYNMMRAWQGGFGTVTVSGMVSPAYVIARPTTDLATSFVEQLLRTSAAVEEVRRLSKGVTDFRLRLYWDEFKTLKIAIPSEPEQASIAVFLDRETAKIDGLIAEQERLIELLAEKRRAVVSHAVTKGLDPNAPMKDSGIAWLGEVPAHWEVKALRWVVQRIEQGWSPECLSRPAEGDEWGVLKTGCVNGGTFRSEENKSLPPDLDPMPTYEVRVGDVLMSRANGSPALVGSTGFVFSTPARLMLSDKIYRIQLEAGHLPRWFVVLMSASIMRNQIVQAISGADGLANNLPQSSLRAFICAVPPESEQRAIVAHLDRVTADLDALTAEATRAVDLLKERRAALISAAVTGKIDVRGLVEEAA